MTLPQSTAPPDLPAADRSAVFAALAAMLADAGTGQRGVGVLIVRVGNLRRVTLDRGYAVGDRVLAEAGALIASVARRRDWCARFGDQDFVLLLRGILSFGQIQLCANKLLQAAGAASRTGDELVPLHLTMGAAAFPEHGADAAELLHRAEQALARAEERMVPFEGFEPAAAEETAPAWRIEALFDRAFERGEFELHYQPKVDLRSGRRTGAEALSRWTSAELGPISPALFIPVAERSGHIERLTWSSINAALQQTAAWRAAGHELAVAVNLSAACLGSADLSERVCSALELWGVPPHALVLEVTESAVMRDHRQSFALLTALRELGVHVSIDDFGTGYSSLAYFRHLPATELKIDRSFVRNLRTNAADRHLVQTIVDLAHRFGLLVVAEGIEDRETLELLCGMGCDLGQGFHIGRPVPPGELFAAAPAAPAAAPVEP